MTCEINRWVELRRQCHRWMWHSVYALDTLRCVLSSNLTADTSHARKHGLLQDGNCSKQRVELQQGAFGICKNKQALFVAPHGRLRLVGCTPYRPRSTMSCERILVVDVEIWRAVDDTRTQHRGVGTRYKILSMEAGHGTWQSRRRNDVMHIGSYRSARSRHSWPFKLSK